MSRTVRSLLLATLFATGCSAPPPAVADPGTPGVARDTATPAPTPTPAPSPTPVPREPVLRDEIVQSGLRVPWDVAFAPDGRMFITERFGNIVVFASGEPNAARVGGALVSGMRAQDEAGLMGIALHPEFARNGFVYVCASRTEEGQWRNQVLRYRADGNDLQFESFILRAGIRANSFHNGCTLRFGPDGKLWMSMGESGARDLAQDPNSLNGKILRMNADGSVPDDNPVLPGASGRSLAHSFGHRNPQGIAFQPGTNSVFATDHGDRTHDEINVLRAGANYGWPSIMGPGDVRFVDPLWSSGGSTIATSGATFLRGTQWGTWQGSLIVATLKEQDLRRFSVNGTTVTPAEVLLNNKYGRLRSPVIGPDGSLYVTTSNGSGDRVIRVIATQPGG